MSFVTYADSENESEFGSAEMEMESTRSTPPHFADQDLKPAPLLQSSVNRINGPREDSMATNERRSRDLRTSDSDLSTHARDKSLSMQASKKEPPADHDSEGPWYQTYVTKTERVDYAEDFMQTIHSRVLNIPQSRQSNKVDLTLCIPCNVRWFMEHQFGGSNRSLGRVIVLSGTATLGQATTCSDYVYSNWPLRGPWLLGLLQDAFETAEKPAKDHNHSLDIYELKIRSASEITADFFGSKEAATDVVQLLVWLGAAFQLSYGQLQYSQPSLQHFRKSFVHRTHFTVNYEKSPVSEESCWFSLFDNPVIAKGFPVPKRSNSELGLELPIELMATLGGGRHAVEFEGGLVIKGHSTAFVPVKQYEETIQWHMISDKDGNRLRYSDLKASRALRSEVDYHAIRTKRAILGWSRTAISLLGTADFNYNAIDWSEAKEAGRSTRFSGGGLGFSSHLIGQFNFVLGAKDGRLHVSHDGPLEKIIDLAEKTPVVLYDHRERRAWLVPALEVILHVIHTRSQSNLYKLDGAKTNISYSDGSANISAQAAKQALVASKDQQLYEGASLGEKAYCVRDAILDVWSLLERMMERDAVITSAPGVALRGTMRDKLYGWEFRALVEDKSNFRQKEQVLEKTNGGWVDLVHDTDTIVLFGNGFQEIIEPVYSPFDNESQEAREPGYSPFGNGSQEVREPMYSPFGNGVQEVFEPLFSSFRLCSSWRRLPKGKDYLAVGCPMLETLYNEAGSRRTRSYLTSRHLQWHQGSTLFEECEVLSDCTCDRLQQLVYDSRIAFGQVSPPIELPLNGCVIFGRAHHPMLPAKRTYAKQRSIYSIPNRPLPEARLMEAPDGDDLSSVFDSSPSISESGSENEIRTASLKRRRKFCDRDAGKRDSLCSRQKKVKTMELTNRDPDES